MTWPFVSSPQTGKFANHVKQVELSVRGGTLGCGLTVSVILRRSSHGHDAMIASKAERRPRKSPGLG